MGSSPRAVVARAAAASSPTPSRGHGLQLELGDRAQRQAFEPAIRANEAGHEVGSRVGQQLRRRPELGQHAAHLQDRDEVAHLDRLVDVVGDEHDRLGQLLLEAQQLVLQPLADDRDRPRRTARP